LPIGILNDKFLDTQFIFMKPLLILIISFFSFSANAQLFKLQCETAEHYPEFPGGDKALVYYLRDTLSNKLQRKGIVGVGEVQVHAVIKETGIISDVWSSNNPNPQLSKEAESVVASMPRWAPAVSNGQPVSCNVIFNIDASGNVAMDAKSLGNISVVVNPENVQQASTQTLSRLAGVMQDYLLQKLPSATISGDYSGSVNVRFGMYPDGWVGRIKLLKGDNKKLEEAVTATINLFNEELAENRVNFKDELMRTFVATVTFK
jgi:hypothetical protein